MVIGKTILINYLVGAGKPQLASSNASGATQVAIGGAKKNRHFGVKVSQLR